MENKATVSETLRKIVSLEGYLKEITELSEEAFEVFDPLISLGDMNERFDPYWKKLLTWNLRNKKAPHIRMQSYSEVHGSFSDVTSARINREEFKESLKKSCEAIEDCIKRIQEAISEEENKLDELYKEFVQNTGDLKFIFESEHVKALIMNNLLKA